jgi:hypothetical protein
MIDPGKVCLFIPAGLKDFKLNLFNRIGAEIVKLGGKVVIHDPNLLKHLPAEIIPIVGCSPELREIIAGWRSAGRPWIYWDRGYARRVFATWLPRGAGGGFYRWHLNSFQLQKLRDVPGDRWQALNVPCEPWKKQGEHIVIASPTRTYAKFHACEGWIADTIDALARVTDRQLVIRDKESKRPLQADLRGAHAMVTHASIAAVESVILGCPVFVHKDSAAAVVGQTDLTMIERPVYPDREKWLWSLAASQWNEQELVDGTLWRQLA